MSSSSSIKMFWHHALMHILYLCVCVCLKNLFPGKPAEDEVKLGSLKLKPNTKIMMMGTREESLVGDWDIKKLLCKLYNLQLCQTYYLLLICV